MEKVIIVHGAATIGLKGENEFSYQPKEIQAAIKEGYTIKTITPVIPNGTVSTYAIVFVLSKASQSSGI